MVLCDEVKEQHPLGPPFTLWGGSGPITLCRPPGSVAHQIPVLLFSLLLYLYFDLSFDILFLCFSFLLYYSWAILRSKKKSDLKTGATEMQQGPEGHTSGWRW